MSETAESTPFRLSPPAFVYLESPDGTKRERIDLYKARRMLEEAGKQPTEQARCDLILKWIADKLQLEFNDLAESMAVEFNNFVCKEVERVKEQLSKKLGETAYSQQSIPESRPTT